MDEATVVLGAGYAGVMAANRLAGRGTPVTVVTTRPDFVERIRLHRVASGDRPSARVPLTDLLNPGVELLLDPAQRIDAAGHTVHLDSGQSLPYRTLVYAVGSGAPKPNSQVHRVASETETLALRDALRTRPAAPVTVIGAGLTGVELAAVLAVSGRTVTVVTSASMTERREQRAHLRRLQRLGVTVIAGTHHDPATTASEAITIDTAGFAVPTLALDSGLPTTADGRLIVDATLRVREAGDIVGAGDAVFVDDPALAHLRASCAAALPMGAHAADVVSAMHSGAAPSSFSFGFMLHCVDLGGRNGRAQLVRADDGERAFAIPGRPGGLVKETICRYTVDVLRKEATKAGAFSWAAGPKVPVAAQP